MGRGGLVRAAATTAVVAGTATAVSGGIRGRQEASQQQAAEAQAYEQQQQQAQMQYAAQQAVAAQQAQQAAAAPAPAAAPSNDMMAQLQNLASMHSQGILSDEEFAAAKAKLLG
ncbi:SHOCT domain-containing protein [Diaminobutyricibacter tongyongensis]|uniref:SHOCT domain-containing protein n=2 Tax=Leifsonia tongyongensis TaxID=1268043 RepID=A0A6L9XX29_9MICO|nr:SHOCT domain-containing protein [Diaminobutyricibacter tongyongensis]